jgi:hypothetical protein
MDVFSICTDWKMWVFFPSTTHNLEVFYSAGKSARKLFRHHEELRDGLFAVASPWDAIYIPAGYLHATYALKGSATIGTTWSSAEALECTVDALVAELYPNAQVPVSSRNDVVYFLRSLVQAFHLRTFATCKAAMQKLCWVKVGIVGRVGPLFGPNWGLNKGSMATEITGHLVEIGSAIAASRQSDGFWDCEEHGCGTLLGHIWTEEEMNKARKKKGGQGK